MIATRSGLMAAPPEAGRAGGAAGGPGARAQHRAELGGPLAHGGEADPVGPAQVDADAVVDDVNLDLVVGRDMRSQQRAAGAATTFVRASVTIR